MFAGGQTGDEISHCGDEFLARTIGEVVDLADDGAAPINGTGIDRTGHMSCVLLVQGGAATGAPTGQTADFVIEDSDTVGGSYLPYVPEQGGQVGAAAAAAAVQETADDFVQAVSINLRGAKTFIRVVTTVILTAGTSPLWPISAALILGPKDDMPA